MLKIIADKAQNAGDWYIAKFCNAVCDNFHINPSGQDDFSQLLR